MVNVGRFKCERLVVSSSLIDGQTLRHLGVGGVAYVKSAAVKRHASCSPDVPVHEVGIMVVLEHPSLVRCRGAEVNTRDVRCWSEDLDDCAVIVLNRQNGIRSRRNRPSRGVVDVEVGVGCCDADAHIPSSVDQQPLSSR